MNKQMSSQLVKASPKADAQATINISRCSKVNTLEETNKHAEVIFWSN